jgi:hypothetical protein
MIYGAERVVHSITFLTNSVTPVLVTGAHLSLKRNACGTMDTGDKRRYDSFVFCSRPYSDVTVGLAGHQ